jgi:hypothetical protein
LSVIVRKNVLKAFAIVAHQVLVEEFGEEAVGRMQIFYWFTIFQ